MSKTYRSRARLTVVGAPVLQAVGRGYDVPVNRRVVLASGSPRRRALMRSVVPHVVVEVPDVDESSVAGESPGDLVARLAALKAGAVRERCVDHQRSSTWIVAADTVVVLGDAILGKPASDDEARETLTRLSGTTHAVATGHHVVHQDRSVSTVVWTPVTFRALSTSEIDRYVASGEGRDKAGAYGIQGLGAALVASVSGCYANVVGLSVQAVVDALRTLGFGDV